MSKDYALVFNENVKEQSRSEKWIMTDNASFHLWFQLCISPKGFILDNPCVLTKTFLF
jgi:hypothetical protein